MCRRLESARASETTRVVVRHQLFGAGENNWSGEVTYESPRDCPERLFSLPGDNRAGRPQVGLADFATKYDGRIVVTDVISLGLAAPTGDSNLEEARRLPRADVPLRRGVVVGTWANDGALLVTAEVVACEPTEWLDC